MAKSALEKWKEENRQNKPVASSGTNKLEQWKQENRQNKPVTAPALSTTAAPVTRGPSATSVYGSANRTAPMDMETRNTLMAAATEIAARQAEEQRRKKQQEAFMSNPRASTAYARQTEKAPVQDRAQKVAEIRKDIDTTPVQSRVGKGLQSIGLSTPASIEYLGESAKQAYKNQQAYEESDLQQRIAEAYSNLNLTERQYGWGSPKYEQARQNYDAVVAQLNAFKNATDKAVDMDSRAAQFMGGVQKLQEEALEGTSGAGRFLGEAALSIGSNLAKLPANAIIPGASLALMGAEAAAGKAYELGQHGVNAGQALARGLVSGGIEALTEKVPLDNLVDIIKTGGKTGLMNVLKQAVTEAGEEGVAYLLNLGADKVAGDPEAEFVWNDFIRSMGLGALSGGVMGGGATAINRASASAVGKNYQEVAPELIEEGLQMNRDTDAYRTAAEMRRKLDAGKTLSNVDVGRVVQDNETAMAPLRQAAMEMAEEQVEREVQSAMPKRTAVRPLATEQRAAYTESNRTTEGGVNGGEEVHLRESGQRNDRAYPGGEVPRMEESAGRDQSGQDSRLPAKDARAADLRVGEEVSTASLGIGNGASNDRIRVVTGGDTEATTKARAIAKERGLRLTLFTGGNLTINGEECRAYITGDRAFVRADHSDFDADQLMRHEAGHDQIAKGEIDIKAATENIRKRLGGRNNVQRAAQTYASAFAGADMTVEEAIEEIICDSLGDMNVFSDTAVETAFGEVLESAKAAAGESRVESKTGPPANGKASRETDYTTRGLNWALREGAISKKNKADLIRAIDNEIFRGYAIPKTKDGNYIVESGNVMMVTNGDRHDPSLEMVIVLDDEYETFMATAKEVIYNEARYGDVHAAARVIEGIYWPGYVRFYDAEAYRADGKYERNRKRSLRQRLEDEAAAGEDVSEALAALGVESDGGSVGKASRETNREDVLKAVEKSDDIRHSLFDSDGKQLTKEQQEYFKDSKVRDEKGNLKVMYHGSRKAGFHVFDAGKSDDHISFFFVDRNNVAETYSGTDETYAAKTLRTAEDFYSLFEEIEAEGVYEVKEENGKFVLYDMGEVVAESDTAQGLYEEWTDYAGVGYGIANYKVYLNLKNPLVVDAEGRNWNNLVGWSKAANLKAEDVTVKRVGDEFRLYKNEQEIENASITVNQYNQNMDTDVLKSIMVDKANNILSITTEGKTTTRDVSKWAKAQGYDGVIFNNIVDAGSHGNGSEGAATVAIAFDSNQIKSVANEKPTSAPDIRFSREASRKDVLKAVENLLAEAESKLDEQELADQMYYGRKAEVQKRNAQEKLERLREQKNERIAQVKAEGREAVKAARIEERVKRDERIAQIEEAHKAELKDTVTAERMAAGREMAAVKQRYKERVEQSRESRSATKRRAQILRHVNKVQQLLLRPTDKNHVPESLRKATASVLSAINTESGFEVMLGKDNKRRRVAEGTAGAEATKRTQAFAALKKACEEIMKNAEDSIILDPDLLGDSANGIPGLLDQLAELKNKRIADMNNDELDIVWRVLRSIEHSISSAGKVLSAAKYERTAEWADAFVADTASKRSKKGNRLEAMRLDLENPYTFFGHYGEAGKAVFRMLRDAQDEQQLMVENIRGMVQTFVDTKTVESLEKETHDFTTEAGDKLTLNTAQVMEIYLLMKREQAHDHLMKGGIVQPEVKSRKINRGTDAIKLSYNDITAITKVLTDKQREIANNLQMLTTTTLADYGNEASMKVYGYKKFTGTDYWPIKSAGEGIHTNVEKGGNNTRSIKNIGMAKAVMPKASNALDINSVFSTFASHTADMVDYAAWLCPMEDANRLFNFQFRDEDGNKTGRTMKGLLDRFGGKDAQKYWSGLMEDIQNGIKAQSDTAILQPVNKMIGNVRGASVGANLRVIVQQPTAILRASAVLTPEAMFRGMFIGGGWKTALEHSPVAMRKDMGGFDISSPMQMNEILFDNKTKLQRVNEFFMAGAGKADAITWGRIWNACESEVAWDNKNLKPGTDEFYEKVNELFTEVIDQSQVVDGVLQRSRAMRSSNTFVQQATAFMGEPTMALNMMLRAYDNFASETDGKKRTAARKAFGKTAMALVLTNAINALAQSLVDALRDDSDEEYTAKVLNAFTGIADEETAWEKATAAVLSGNFGSSLNPVGYVPFAKDILSLLQGYNVTRADADVVGDIISSVKTFSDSIAGDGKRSIAYATKNLAQQVSKVFGVSAANLLRDAWGIARTIAQETGNIELQYEMEKAIYKLSNDGNTSRFTKLLYKAYNADEEAYNHIYADMESAGVDMEKVRKQMEKLLKEEQGVTDVDDLDSRYLNPTLQKTYDSAMQTVRVNKLWDKATEKQQDKVEDILYELTVGSASGKKMQEKIDGGKAAGIDTADFLLYKLAMEMYDQPTENGKYGTYTQEEVEDAIKSIAGLSSAERRYLWTVAGKKEDKSPW